LPDAGTPVPPMPKSPEAREAVAHRWAGPLRLLQTTWGVFLCALALRLVLGLALLSSFGPDFPMASDDGDSYDAAARWVVWGDHVIHGRQGDSLLEVSPDPAARWPQAYWLYLALHYWLWGHQHLPILLAQAALGAAGVAAAYQLARRVLPPRGALAAGYLVAASAPLVFLSASLSAEALYIPLLLIALWLTVRSADADSGARAHRVAFAAGAVFGVAQATRPVALPVFAVAAVWAWWAQRPRRSAAASALVPAAGFATALLPFMLRDLWLLGRIAVFTVGGSEAFHGPDVAGDVLGPELAALGVDPYGAGSSQAVLAVLKQPEDVLSAVGRALPGRLATVFLVGGWGPVGEPLLHVLGPLGVLARAALWPLAVFGILWIARSRGPARRVGWLLVAVTVAVLLPFLFLGKPLIRYRVPLDPVFTIWMVAGAVALCARVRRLTRFSFAHGARAASG
jgi:hypothetical protein